jgi:hypothetical protein
VFRTLTLVPAPAMAESRFSLKGYQMREHDKSARLLVLILVLGVGLVSSRPVFAARFVPVSVSINGKVVIKSGRWDNGRVGADTLWRYLKDLKFQPIDGLDVEPDREDPLRATLTGDVAIDVRYGGRADVSSSGRTRTRRGRSSQRRSNARSKAATSRSSSSCRSRASARSGLWSGPERGRRRMVQIMFGDL